MRGQWIGTYNGTNSGSIIANIDEFSDGFGGSAYLKDSKNVLPGTVVFFKTSGKNSPANFRVPISERKTVVHELGYMGITAGSLFPGLDGACEELRERNFEI